MNNFWKSFLQVDLASAEQRAQLSLIARRRNWGLALLLVGWLHLLAFATCYYLTVYENYHDSLGYLLIWSSELLGAWAIFRLCGGPRPADLPVAPLESFVRRVWISYFILAFDLGSLNTLRGNHLFEFFPAIAPLASFAFMMLTVAVSWRFFGATVLMYISGLLMAAHLTHAYLIFALVWWLVLNWIGLGLWLKRQREWARLHLAEPGVNGWPGTQRRATCGGERQ